MKTIEDLINYIETFQDEENWSNDIFLIKCAAISLKQELSKLHQPTVIVCLHPFNEVVSGDDGDFCCKCQTYLKSNRL